MIARRQLLDAGLSSEAIAHRLRKGKLHPVQRGVYAVGRPEVNRAGHWMAAVLACGPGALLSHASAAAAWEIGKEGRAIEVSVEAPRTPRRPGIVVHRRTRIEEGDRAFHDRIPVTSPVRTLLDLAMQLAASRLEAAVNAADKFDLIDPEALREELDRHRGERGASSLRRLLDRRTFVLTESELERRLLPIARSAGLPPPETGVRLNGFKVDFFWPGLGLVVETDGLRYHRTPAQQARDRVRDQAHAAAGLTPLRFTHDQVAHEARRVEATLRRVARRLGRGRASAHW